MNVAKCECISHLELHLNALIYLSDYSDCIVNGFRDLEEIKIGAFSGGYEFPDDENMKKIVQWLQISFPNILSIKKRQFYFHGCFDVIGNHLNILIDSNICNEFILNYIFYILHLII